MGLFNRKPAGEKARVKKFRKPEKPGQKGFGFLTLADGREVYFNGDHLAKAKITNLDIGQEVYVEYEPSTKKPGALQAISISS